MPRRTMSLDTVPAEVLAPPTGEAQLVIGAEHLNRVVRDGMLKAKVSLDIASADFKAMLVPTAMAGIGGSSRGGKGRGAGGRGGRRGSAESIVEVFRRLAERGVEIRLLHSGVPSSPALRELREVLPRGLTIRRCPRIHMKTIIVDAAAMYLGSANLTGAGLGAKGEHKRNFELGVWTESTALIDAVLSEFNAIWEGRRCEKCLRKDVCPVPLEEPELGKKRAASR